MEQSLLVRSLVRSPMVRLMQRLMVQSPLKQVLQRGEDASESIGLMSCLLRRQSDPKRPRQ